MNMNEPETNEGTVVELGVATKETKEVAPTPMMYPDSYFGLGAAPDKY